MPALPVIRASIKKTLRPTVPRITNRFFAVLRDGEHQARYVVEQIRRLHNAGLAWRDMAVLYRAHYHAMQLQMTLPGNKFRLSLCRV